MATSPVPAHERTSGKTTVGVEERVRLLKAIADPTRLAVLDRLACCGPHGHCDLEDLLDVPTSRLSFHLKVLREAGLVRSERDGKRVHYRLADGAFDRICRAVPVAADGEDGPRGHAAAAGVINASVAAR
ncbi:MAG: ArsR/SmtB family transcription factor [Nitriliruptoraceae bacterium]